MQLLEDYISASIEKFYDDVKVLSADIDKQKRRRRKMLILGSVLLCAVVGHIIYSIANEVSSADMGMYMFVYVTVGIFILGFFIAASSIKGAIKLKYKHEYLNLLAGIFSPKLTFTKRYTKSKLSISLNDSSLFSLSKYYRGEEIKGEFEGKEIQIEEAEEKRKWYLRLRKKVRGVLIVAKSNKQIGDYGRFSNVIVTTDFTGDAINVFDKMIIKAANKFLQVGEKVNLEHPAFEKYLNCYAKATNGNSQIFGRYVMSPRLIQSMVDISADTGAHILFEACSKFYGDNLGPNQPIVYHMMLNFKRNMFEYSLYKTKFTEEECLADIKQLYFIVKTAYYLGD